MIETTHSAVALFARRYSLVLQHETMTSDESLPSRNPGDGISRNTSLSLTLKAHRTRAFIGAADSPKAQEDVQQKNYRSIETVLDKRA
jgi:hypothetical protein